jgi:GNAT superfamily N-acetyltransferase
VVIAWRREDTRLPHVAAGVDRPAPIPEAIDPEHWLDVVVQTRGGTLPDWEYAVVRHQASIPCARFYGIRIGDNAVSCCARYDLPDASRVDTLHVDPDFRGTGFGRATLARTIREAPVDRIYGTFDDANLAMAAVGQRLGGAIVLRDVVRRFVGKWEDSP